MFKETKRNEAGEIKCVQGIRDFEESMFDPIVLGCKLLMILLKVILPNLIASLLRQFLWI